MRDGRAYFILGTYDESSAKSIGEMLENMEELDPAPVFAATDYLTEEQALALKTPLMSRIASTFSLVMDYIGNEDLEAFSERANKDGKMNFYSLIGW